MAAADDRAAPGATAWAHDPVSTVTGGSGPSDGDPSDGPILTRPLGPWQHARSLVVGIAGGSGSGKSTVVTAVVDAVGHDRVAVLPHDAYYHDLSSLPIEQRRAANFDHPHAFDDELFSAHLKRLREGHAVAAPTYDFGQSVRLEQTRPVQPRPIIIADGILLFASPRLRRLFDVKVFVDTDDDLRLLRRLRRDVRERGRSVASVLDQYEKTVRPMHLEFVEPSKRWADVLIPRGGGNRVAIEMLVRALGTHLDAEEVTSDDDDE